MSHHVRSSCGEKRIGHRASAGEHDTDGRALPAGRGGSVWLRTGCVAAMLAVWASPVWAVVVPFAERLISTTADSATSVYAADLDGDGDIDVLSTSVLDNEVAWYENTGGILPNFIEHLVSLTAESPVSVYAADMDGDGDTDVLSASVDDDKIAWYQNGGGTPPIFTERVISTNADDARSVYAVDMDGDGDTDVLSASFADDKIAWYENIGGVPPTFIERVISTVANGADSVYAADVDGDGDTDALSASFTDNTIAWYENNGGTPPIFTERVISTAAEGARSVYATDVDGDGDTDVLSASETDDTIAWYDNLGGIPPIFIERIISTAADSARAVYATDVDGDGDTDVLSASFADDKIAWYENLGGAPPIFIEHVISTDAAEAVSVYAADVDGDEDTDVLSASTDDDKVAWYANGLMTLPFPICGLGAGLANLAFFWTACLVWLVGQKLRATRPRG